MTMPFVVHATDPGSRARRGTLQTTHGAIETPVFMDVGTRATVTNCTPADLVDVVDAAQRLGTPVRFVRRLIAERRIRFYKVGRYVRLDPADLDAFIAAGQVDPSR